MQVRKQHLEPYMEQLTGSKLGKEYIKAAYCHHAYSTYTHSTSCEMLGWMKQMLGWMKHKLESRLQEKYQNLRYEDDTTLTAESEEELKAP